MWIKIQKIKKDFKYFGFILSNLGTKRSFCDFLLEKEETALFPYFHCQSSMTKINYWQPFIVKLEFLLGCVTHTYYWCNIVLHYDKILLITIFSKGIFYSLIISRFSLSCLLTPTTDSQQLDWLIFGVFDVIPIHYRIQFFLKVFMSKNSM